jgi:DNA-binding NarL/FixJ family response regulator
MIPALRAAWDAEQTRLAGASDPAGWAAAAMAWEDLGYPHEAGYAWWRKAEADLAAGHRSGAVAALRAAAAAAGGHAPLQAEIRRLARLARVSLAEPAAPPPSRQLETPALYGLTGRELAVLRLIAAGRTNSQIGAELYIATKTASVHVTSILRKLGVSSRVQAAALAERAGLLDTPQA